jgi:hypothetical protein
MQVRSGSLHRLFSKSFAAGLTLISLFAFPYDARAQYVEIQNLEITPFVGARFGGTFDVQTEQHVLSEVSMKDASSYGFSAGLRFDDFSLIEFRWTRSSTSLQVAAPSPAVILSSADISLNQFHADFTREFVIPEVKGLRSFLTGSVGATHIGSTSDGFTRFSFGLGAGLKQFVGSRLAIRAEAHWLPILVDPEVSTFACGTGPVGGCLVVLNGRLTQQFEVSVGPVVRF